MTFLAAQILCLSPMLGVTQMEQVPLSGPAHRLTQVEYYPAPNDKQVRLRLTGTKTTPLPESRYAVDDLTIDFFGKTNNLEAAVTAPKCVYAPFDSVADSDGHLQLSLKDDKFHIEGDGFMWRQNEYALVISNNVHATIKAGAWKMPTL